MSEVNDRIPMVCGGSEAHDVIAVELALFSDYHGHSGDLCLLRL